MRGRAQQQQQQQQASQSSASGKFYLLSLRSRRSKFLEFAVSAGPDAFEKVANSLGKPKCTRVLLGEIVHEVTEDAGVLGEVGRATRAETHVAEPVIGESLLKRRIHTAQME